MKKISCDVDIDFLDRAHVLSLIPHIVASRIEDGVYKKHNTGIYLQQIPFNPLTGLSTIDYEVAASRGYFKIDFLNVSAYAGIKDESHIERLLAIEPEWELLCEKDICDRLAHINGYHHLLSRVKPTSISELAMVLAMIRPGKRHLISKCETEGFDSIKDEIWEKSVDGIYAFKKSHSVSYAHLIILQLNLICQEAIS
jgi:hypothetical protein